MLETTNNMCVNTRKPNHWKHFLNAVYDKGDTCTFRQRCLELLKLHGYVWPTFPLALKTMAALQILYNMF